MAAHGPNPAGVNRYDDYGLPAPGNQGTFQYTGQAKLTGVDAYDYKARIYSPVLRRFLQPDPIGYAGGQNLYAYVKDDPINTRDPLGLCGFLTPASGNYVNGEFGAVPEQVFEGGCTQTDTWGLAPFIFSGWTAPGGPSEALGEAIIQQWLRTNPPSQQIRGLACKAAGLVPGNRMRVGADGVIGLGALFVGGLGVSLEDDGRVVADVYGGFGAGVALLGGAQVGIDNQTTPNGISGSNTGLFGQAAFGMWGGGLAVHNLNLSDPKMMDGSLSVGVGPKVGGAVGWAKTASYGKTLFDFNCGRK